jgi:hypothetical protein
MAAALVARTTRVEVSVKRKATYKGAPPRLLGPRKATTATTTARNPLAHNSNLRRSQRSITTPVKGLMTVYGMKISSAIRRMSSGDLAASILKPFPPPKAIDAASADWTMPSPAWARNWVPIKNPKSRSLKSNSKPRLNMFMAGSLYGLAAWLELIWKSSCVETVIRLSPLRVSTNSARLKDVAPLEPHIGWGLSPEPR